MLKFKVGVKKRATKRARERKKKCFRKNDSFVLQPLKKEDIHFI